MSDGAIRFARIRRASVPNTAEEGTLNFNLGHKEAAKIFSATLLVEALIHTTATSFDFDSLIVSLHRETESLESALDAEVDEVIVDSEIIAQWSVQMGIQDEAATRGGSAVSMVWNSPRTWVFKDIAGEPIITRRNLTGRFITSATELSALGPEIVVVYSIIEPTNAELLALANERR